MDSTVKKTTDLIIPTNYVFINVGFISVIFSQNNFAQKRICFKINLFYQGYDDILIEQNVGTVFHEKTYLFILLIPT